MVETRDFKQHESSDTRNGDHDQSKLTQAPDVPASSPPFSVFVLRTKRDDDQETTTSFFSSIGRKQQRSRNSASMNTTLSLTEKMPNLPRISLDTLGLLRLSLDDDKRFPECAVGESEENVPVPRHPVMSFFQLLQKRFREQEKARSRVQRMNLRDNIGAEKDGDVDDDEFLRIEFSTVDDVIEFYRNDEDYKEECLELESEIDRIEGRREKFCDPSQSPRATSAENFEQDAIVSSWIDNYHFLLAEQEKREQKRKKQVRFETKENDDGDDGDGDDDECGSSPHDNSAEDDNYSLASSSCSTSTDSTWCSMDSIEKHEFEEFARWWDAQSMHGKNTNKSIWRRLLREVLVGPSDEDFEIHDDSIEEFGSGDGIIVFEETSENDGMIATSDRSNEKHPFGADNIATEMEMHEFSSDRLPTDLLFSIDDQ